MSTSLTDIDAQSYQPTGYDVMADEGAPLGKYALPGASLNFSIIFRVPPETKLKDLFFPPCATPNAATTKAPISAWLSTTQAANRTSQIEYSI